MNSEVRNLAHFCGPCLAHSNSSLAGRILTGLALSYGQGSAAIRCALNESPSLGTSATGEREQRLLADSRGEGGKANSCTNPGRHSYCDEIGIKI